MDKIRFLQLSEWVACGLSLIEAMSAATEEKAETPKEEASVADDTAGADADPPEKPSGEKVKGVVNWFNVAKGFGASSWLSRHPACSSVAILRTPPGGGVDSTRERPLQASSIAGVFPGSSPRREVLGSARNADPPLAQPRSLFARSHAIFMRNRVRARGSRRSAGAVSDIRSAPREPIDALGGASCVVARGEPSGTLRANPHRWGAVA